MVNYGGALGKAAAGARRNALAMSSRTAARALAGALGAGDEGRAEEAEEEENEFAALSTLDAHTVKWLNRRKALTGPRAALYKYHTTLANALPYKAIFKGLDTADEGDIELGDIEDVIKKLSTPRPGEPPLFDDPKAILQVRPLPGCTYLAPLYTPCPTRSR